MTGFRQILTARTTLLLLSVALLADLLLDWRRASIETPAVDLEAGASGINGWGALAAVLVVALLVARLRDARPTTILVLAAGAAAFTIVEFFTGSATVETGAVAVDTSTRLWPAYLGLALAAAVLAAAAAPTLEPAPAAAPAAPPGHVRVP
jgi:hypothetical protein